MFPSSLETSQQNTTNTILLTAVVLLDADQIKSCHMVN